MTTKHVSNDIRDDFEELLYEAGEIPEEDQRLRRLLKELQGCTDIMSSRLCWYLDLEQGSTYGEAVWEIQKRQRTSA